MFTENVLGKVWVSTAVQRRIGGLVQIPPSSWHAIKLVTKQIVKIVLILL